MIDLRSDTVTRPTEEMRRAMHLAEVGDDVYGEDPTVTELQVYAADVLGKEAALFVPSGTMANQIGLLVHAGMGHEVIVERKSHIFNHEGGAAAWLSSVQLLPLTGTRGMLSADEIAAAVRPGFYGEPESQLICIENTHNMAGGVPQDLDTIRSIYDLAQAHQLKMHMDGARLWNAAVASGISEATYARYFDTVNVCLSKGLGAPVGSLLAGSRALISKAAMFRKRLGGGMRQSGIVAAAGLYALRHHRERLAEDHTHARQLADAIADLPGFRLAPQQVQTNIVIFEVPSGTAPDVVAQLRAHNILMAPTSANTVRAVTHLDLSSKDIDQTINRLQHLFGQRVWASG